MPYLNYTCPNDDCGQVEVETEVDPAESNYGADADGNRGIYVPASAHTPDTPSECPDCGMVYTAEQMEAISKELEKAARNWEPPDPNWDYPEDWED